MRRRCRASRARTNISDGRCRSALTSPVSTLSRRWCRRRASTPTRSCRGSRWSCPGCSRTGMSSGDELTNGGEVEMARKMNGQGRNWGRRKVLKDAAGLIGAVAGSGIAGAPTIWAQNIKNITLRQCGTGVSAFNEIAEKAKADLGFTLQMTALDSDAVVQRVVTQPNSFDIGDIEYWMVKKVFPAKTLQAMDTKKIKYFDKIVPIFTSGKLKPDSVIAQGTAPHSVGFVEGKDSTKFAKGQTQWFTAIPTIYNADTLGIRPDLVGREITQWKDILDPKFKGKTSILNVPSIGIMDAAMICESAGIMKYADKGNMTKAEIDKTIDFLIKTKKEGQFRAFWKTFDESVNLMASG